MPYTSEEFKGRVLGYHDEYKSSLPLKFWEDIGNPWFSLIFPVRNEMYGVEGLQRLGPTHAVAEFVGCYYRWSRMTDLSHSVQEPPMRDSIMDAFGYSVIMRAMSESDIRWMQVDRRRKPATDLDTLIGFYWDDMLKVDDAACTMATRISVNMYRRTVGA